MNNGGSIGVSGLLQLKGTSLFNLSSGSIHNQLTGIIEGQEANAYSGFVYGELSSNGAFENEGRISFTDGSLDCSKMQNQGLVEMTGEANGGRMSFGSITNYGQVNFHGGSTASGGFMAFENLTNGGFCGYSNDNQGSGFSIQVVFSGITLNNGSIELRGGSVMNNTVTIQDSLVNRGSFYAGKELSKPFLLTSTARVLNEGIFSNYGLFRQASGVFRNYNQADFKTPLWAVTPGMVHELKGSFMNYAACSFWGPVYATGSVFLYKDIIFNGYY